MGGFASLITSLENSFVPFLGPYRPWQWSFQPQTVSLTANIPSTASDLQTTNVSSVISTGETTPGTTTQFPSGQTTTFTPTTYFFDAVFREEHSQRLESTNHPIQNGAAISDHSFLIPARVSLEVGFSDAMDSYISGQYSGYATKSVSAYQQFLYLQQLRIPLTLATKLNTYQNMVIEEIRPHVDVSTANALKMTIVFKQIFLASVTSSSTTSSARTNQSNTSNPGASSPQPVPQSLQGYSDSSGNWSSSGPSQ